ncbi:hypothetical protein OG216_42255 [Streptomycetaceae bacterium NBC_01309]
MASGAGDRFVVRIGGDATGPLVVGSGNRVEIHQAAPDSAPGSAGEPGPESPPAAEPDAATPREAEPTQVNTANDHGTVYTVMEGDMHIHHDAPRPTEDDDAR